MHGALVFNTLRASCAKLWQSAHDALSLLKTSAPCIRHGFHITHFEHSFAHDKGLGLWLPAPHDVEHQVFSAFLSHNRSCVQGLSGRHMQQIRMLLPAHPDRLFQKQITPPLTPGASLTCLTTIPARQDMLLAHLACCLVGSNRFAAKQRYKD